jgi:cytochrome c peroxidase
MTALWRLALLAAIAVIGWVALSQRAPAPWTDDEKTVLRSLWLDSLPPLPEDRSNAVADDLEAAHFGHALFFDRRLSANGAIACSTCHRPERRFADGLAKGQAIGISARNTPSVVATAYSPWLYWDGRRDSQWAQALSPLEDLREHGSDRRQVVSLVATDPDYRVRYERIFGAPPDLATVDALNRSFANVGKAIAAYERLLMPGRARFDEYVAAVLSDDALAEERLFSDDERAGLRLFVGKANCTQCHNGPLFTNNEFHNTGVLSFPGDVPDKGRVQGVRDVTDDPFNCRGAFSDDPARACPELDFARTGPELIGTMRTPSLRNLEDTDPYMHKGQLATLAAVLEHYNEAPLAMIGHNESKPLELSRRQLAQLEAFLRTLAAPLATSEQWLKAPSGGLDAEHDQEH